METSRASANIGTTDPEVRALGRAMITEIYGDPDVTPARANSMYYKRCMVSIVKGTP